MTPREYLEDWKKFRQAEDDEMFREYLRSPALDQLLRAKVMEHLGFTEQQWLESVNGVMARKHGWPSLPAIAFTDIETPEAAPQGEEPSFMVEAVTDGIPITMDHFPETIRVAERALANPMPHFYRVKDKVVIDVANGYAEYALEEPPLFPGTRLAYRVYLKER